MNTCPPTGNCTLISMANAGEETALQIDRGTQKIAAKKQQTGKRENEKTRKQENRFRIFAFSCFPVFALTRFRAFACSGLAIFAFSCFHVFALSMFNPGVFNMPSEYGLFQRKLLSQPSFFRGKLQVFGCFWVV